MESDQQRFFRLLESQSWNQSDRDWLLNYLGSSKAEQLRQLLFRLYQDDLIAGEIIAPDISSRMRHQIATGTGAVMDPGGRMRNKRVIFKYGLRYAAAILFFILAGVFYFGELSKSSNQSQETGDAVHLNDDIEPGRNKAILTLSNGASVMLSDSLDNSLIRQGNTKIIRQGSGVLTYRKEGAQLGMAIPYNTLTTPRGGQYGITFSDGTKVWLNSGSSIRYPTSFTGDTREVEITGECYFEVARDASMPFVVNAGNVAVNVLGTHFDIMSYQDDSLVKTTLLEGSVRVTELSTRQSQLVNPGQQVEVGRNGTLRLVTGVDLEKAVAWKNGLFVFNNDDIHAVMQELARWYDVDVIIKGNISQHFSGSIHRNVKMSKVFEVLQETGGIHFEIDHKKVIVSP